MSNIEDDVKIVKRYLRNSSYKESDSDFFKNGGWEMVDLEIPKAMANILSERDQDKARIKELKEENGKLRIENAKLRVVMVEYEYGYENTHFITKNNLVQIDRNKYLIEVEEGKFVDVKQLYYDSIPKQKVKDVLDDIYDYFERLNVPDEDIEYIESKRKELLEEGE